MGLGTQNKETQMGKLSLEASWISSLRKSVKVHIELDLMIVALLAKLVIDALAR